MDSLIYIFAPDFTENQTSYNHDKANLNHCIFAELLVWKLFSTYFSQIKSQSTIAWLSQYMLEF